MGEGILIDLLEMAVTMIQVDIISGLPHLGTQRLDLFHRFSFGFSAFFAVYSTKTKAFKLKSARHRAVNSVWAGSVGGAFPPRCSRRNNRLFSCSLAVGARPNVRRNARRIRSSVEI